MLNKKLFLILISGIIIFSPLKISSADSSSKKQADPATKITPNELGKILILTYHKLGDEDTEYTRTVSGFRDDIIYLIKNDFHLISLQEFRSGKITSPFGKKPVLLTFDDSSIYQFEMTKDGKIAKNSAIGILEDLKSKYKGFIPKAVFFVTPGSKQPNNLFGQNEFRNQKLNFLVQNGYEIGNHTHWHANLKQYSKLIEEQIAKCQKDVTDILPGYKMYALALPYGIYPKEPDRSRLRKGEYKGISYHNELIFDYSNRLSHSIYSNDYDTMHIRRVHGNKSGVERAFKELKSTGKTFISDGDPETVSIRKSDIDKIKPSWKNRIKFVED
ncbi:polysaccharide deacetylase family protein [Leptospira sp. GIMC2001]|uniref:polysaccharide deacetylase family protein n=1 Tax=Leptospira sp. GIMC2001 TaxID=1513297 RepID=UPI00234AE5E2|nr:polysaccharide deacetylase family protein [Leptospira sp. GIMC2001]WCL48969.1 polysaccharide deacetylase family protein [Leptospira sp. GIMC2001]